MTLDPVPTPATITVPITDDLVHGAIELERTARGLVPHRLPAWARAQCPDPQLAMAESQPSGVRLSMRTAATVIEIDALATRREYVGAPLRAAGRFDLVADGELVAWASPPGGETWIIDLTTGAAELRPGPAGTARFEDLPAGEKDVEIWLPYDEGVTLVGLRADAPVAPLPDRGRRTWLHHGSSISHGSAATHPTGTWPAVAARMAGVELVNLGLAGSALLDPFTARTMRDTPADLISVKLGINVVNQDLMRLRAFGPAVHGFLDTIREGHPITPLLVVSPILCPTHEHTPGPSAPDFSQMAEGRLRFVAVGDPADPTPGRLTLQVIRAELARIVAERAVDDPHLAYLDGREMYGVADHRLRPLPDDLHPDAETQLLMGERFAELAFRGPFAG
ncbi:GDSL-type esterase/lipase family protein [Nocardioides sp.]|uniref:GDSL-type esterase/lipase family protein n=1 Tax=Nocardioides sp. TaxID=35761 RepID=UPI00378333EF